MKDTNSKVQVLTSSQDLPVGDSKELTISENPPLYFEINTGLERLTLHRAIQSSASFRPYDHSTQRTSQGAGFGPMIRFTGR
jgi:hypothetical protein